MEEIINQSAEIYRLLIDFRATNVSFIEVDGKLRDLGFSYIEIQQLTNKIK